MTETTLMRTRVGGEKHTLVLRESSDEIPTSLLVDEPETDDVLAVTYDGPRRFFDAWRVHAGRRPRNVGVVSVGAAMRATSAASKGNSGATGGAQNVVRGVPDPTNPKAVHRAVEGYLDSWPTDGRTVVYFDSVNALVDHVGVDAAREFLDDVLRSLSSYDAACYFCLTPTDDGDCLREIRALFDTVVEFDHSESGAVAESGTTTESETGTESKTVPEPSVTDCFAAIRKPTRRHVLSALRTADGGLSTGELTSHVASAELADRRSVRISLVQRHLPKLSEYGLVTHDRRHERVTRGPHFDRVRPYLRVGDER